LKTIGFMEIETRYTLQLQVLFESSGILISNTKIFEYDYKYKYEYFSEVD
jgi:hypothetical protein